MTILNSLWPLAVTLGVLIFVHELGHFLAAKWAGIRVHRFAIGMGNPIPWLSFRRGETEYAICWLPLGGYVKMATREEGSTSSALEGGSPEDGHLPGESPVRPDEFFEAKPIWKRMIVIMAGVTMNVLFALVAFTVLAAKNGEQIDPVTTVGGILVDSLPHGAEELSRLHTGDRIVAVGGKPVTSWNEISDLLATEPDDSFGVQLADGRTLMVRIHPAALKERSELLSAIGPAHPTVVDRVEGNRPGARAGIQAGDTLLEVDGVPATFLVGVLFRIRSNPGVPLQFRLARAGGPVSVTVTPDSVQEGGHSIGKVGLALAPAVQFQSRKYSGAEALAAGWEATVGASTQIVRTVQGLLSARISSREVGGPILIGQLAARSAQLGLDVLVGMMALVSVNLAVLNLLPVPVLDGGQFLFLLAEGVLRRPLSLKLRERLTLVGLVLILMLMVLAFSNDFVRNWDPIVGFFKRLLHR